MAKQRQYHLKPKPGEVPAASVPTALAEPARLPEPPEPVRALIPVGAEALLRPAAEIEDLVRAFKQYQELKEKLLEETDYTWFVRFTPLGSDRDEMKGFRTRKEAEEFVKKTGRGELEKKIKKSGCLKLSKAFAISTKIIGAEIDPGTRTAWYRVEAEAPNRQTQQRTGYCDGAEKGKSKTPFDSIDATALTRATDRAIMALLGGENTAEEFEDQPPPHEEAKPPAAVAAPAPTSTPPPAPPALPAAAPVVATAPYPGETDPHGNSVAPPPPAAAAPPAHPAEVADLPLPQDTPPDDILPDDQIPPEDGYVRPEDLTEDEWKRQLSEKFDTTKPAKVLDEKTQWQRGVFALAKQVGIGAEQIKDAVKARFDLASFGDATVDQLKETLKYLETKCDDPLARTS